MPRHKHGGPVCACIGECACEPPWEPGRGPAPGPNGAFATVRGDDRASRQGREGPPAPSARPFPARWMRRRGPARFGWRSPDAKRSPGETPGSRLRRATQLPQGSPSALPWRLRASARPATAQATDHRCTRPPPRPHPTCDRGTPTRHGQRSYDTTRRLRTRSATYLLRPPLHTRSTRRPPNRRPSPA